MSERFAGVGSGAAAGSWGLSVELAHTPACHAVFAPSLVYFVFTMSTQIRGLSLFYFPHLNSGCHSDLSQLNKFS